MFFQKTKNHRTDADSSSISMVEKKIYPQIIHFNKVFHYKTIHFGVPQFGNTHIKHPVLTKPSFPDNSSASCKTGSKGAATWQFESVQNVLRIAVTSKDLFYLYRGISYYRCLRYHISIIILVTIQLQQPAIATCPSHTSRVHQKASRNSTFRGLQTTWSSQFQLTRCYVSLREV